jgi:SulP family sulfate permease
LRALRDLVEISRAQAVVAWSTFLLTILLAPRIDVAVLTGVLLGVGVHLWRERRIHIDSVWNEASGELLLEPVGVLYFGSAPVLDDALIAALSEHPLATRLVIDVRRVGRIDYTGALALHRVASDAAAAGLEVRIIPGMRPQGGLILERVFGADARWIVPVDD